MKGAMTHFSASALVLPNTLVFPNSGLRSLVMRTFFIRGLLAVAALALPSRALAWGPDGHRIIAMIASKRLTPDASAWVNELLGNASLVDIATWADEIREDRPETTPWHFVNIPLDGDKFDEDRDGKDGNNVIDQIENFEAILADKSTPIDQRAEALKWVVHLVGDVHQPLHVAVRGHDEGGNTRLVFFLDQQRAVNLHKVWDSSLIRDQMGTTRMTVFANALSFRISSSQEAQWSKGTPEDWANQAHAVAVHVAYAGVPADGPPPKLGEDYVDRAEEAIDEQLQRAGVRLAAVLNRILK
jgi:hypothetical protein